MNLVGGIYPKNLLKVVEILYRHSFPCLRYQVFVKLVNFSLQEPLTRHHNTSSQNEKEMKKKMSKFFVLKLRFSIKPKHLKASDGTLKLKCTAEVGW